MAVSKKPSVKIRTPRSDRGKPADKKTAEKKPVARKAGSSLSIPLYGVKGVQIGEIALDKNYFGLSWNDQLVSQAVRVYRQNQRVGHASAKTRAEVTGSTRKLFKQKGTGKARRGNIRAPIMVGGGIVFGPKPRDYSKTLTKDMRRKALLIALSQKCLSGEVVAIEGLETLPLKTKEFARALLPVTSGRRFVVLVGDETAGTVRAMQNIDRLRVLPVTSLSTNDVMVEKTIVFTKDGMEKFVGYISKE